MRPVALVWLVVRAVVAPAADDRRHQRGPERRDRHAIVQVAAGDRRGRLLAGAAAALWLPTRLVALSATAAHRAARLIVGAAAGAVVGVAGRRRHSWYSTSARPAASIVAIAVTLVVGRGCSAAPPRRSPRPVLAAALAAWWRAGVLVTSVVLSLFQHPLTTALGGGTRAIAAQITGRQSWSAIVQALIEGIVAALVAFRYLRRRDGGRAWPWYLLAGAAPGARRRSPRSVSPSSAGRACYRLVGGFSALDAVYLSYLADRGQLRSGR